MFVKIEVLRIWPEYNEGTVLVCDTSCLVNRSTIFGFTSPMKPVEMLSDCGARFKGCPAVWTRQIPFLTFAFYRYSNLGKKTEALSLQDLFRFLFDITLVSLEIESVLKLVVVTDVIEKCLSSLKKKSTSLFRARNLVIITSIHWKCDVERGISKISMMKMAFISRVCSSEPWHEPRLPATLLSGFTPRKTPWIMWNIICGDHSYSNHVLLSFQIVGVPKLPYPAYLESSTTHTLRRAVLWYVASV